MKKQYAYLVLAVIFCGLYNLHAQDHLVCPGDTLDIPLLGYKSGDIQWQCSFNNSDWTNLPGYKSEIVRYSIPGNIYFRAKVNAGNCEYVSDIRYIVTAGMAECNHRDSMEMIARRTTIGAIRWDAGWVGDKHSISIYTQRQLSPQKFRFRTPFFATIHKPDSVTFTNTQATMDQEIAYAKNGGINYWLYNWFPISSVFDIPLKLHLSSTHKNDMKFCFIFFNTSWQHIMQYELSATMNRIKETNYMKIDGKPVIFCFPSDWTITEINQIRTETKKAGIPEIYLVFMDWSGVSANNDCSRFGGQASSAYCNWGDGGISYSAFAYATEYKWNTHKNPDFAFIPYVTTGWDPRPIIEFYHGLPEADSISVASWYPKPAEDHYVQTATAGEVAAHLKSGLNWVKNNPSYSKPNTVIIYGWNECSEGGFIIPVAETDSASINYGTRRLDAIKSMLDEYWGK